MRKAFPFNPAWGVDDTIRGRMLYLYICQGLTKTEIQATCQLALLQFQQLLKRHHCDYPPPKHIIRDQCVAVRPQDLINLSPSELVRKYSLRKEDVLDGRERRNIRRQH